MNNRESPDIVVIVRAVKPAESEMSPSPPRAIGQIFRYNGTRANEIESRITLRASVKANYAHSTRRSD